MRLGAPNVGTFWCAGLGSSVGELLDALGDGCTAPSDYRLRTGLMLTGQPLSREDERRIKDAIGWAREGR